jgi:exodeoxyribonuclease VII large subunit
MLRDRALRYVATRIEREQDALRSLRARPVLATPGRDVDRRAREVIDLVARARRSLGAGLDRAADDVVHLLARVRSLSPAATLERGYAVVQDGEGRVLRSAAGVRPGTAIGVRLASGRLTATVTSANSDV